MPLLQKMESQKKIASYLEDEASITLNGSLYEVFPLFEPLNEKKWVHGWDPEMVFPSDGRTQERMVFKTKPRFEGEDNYHWILTRLDRENHFIEYAVSTRERIWFIKVALSAMDKNTMATIRYAYLGLTVRGQELNKRALEEMYKYRLNDWEEAINHYLKTSNKIVSEV